MSKKQLKLSNFCAEYDMPRTTVMELKYRENFPVYKIGSRWYVDLQKFLKWRELCN